MARKPRIEFDGAFYHVITRGNQKQKIFKDVSDCQKYLQILTIYKNRYHCRLYAYILMSNHVHLLIETKDTPLSKILQGINQSYTLYFNRRYRMVGHLFQGRYKAILCDQDAYLLALLKYIHQNPLRAKIVETLKDYPWSSHHAYAGKNNPLALIDIDQVLRMLSGNNDRARNKYRQFMSEKQTLGKEEVYATVDQRVQGSEDFVDEVLKKYDGAIRKERKKKEYTLNAISGAVEKRHSVPLPALRSSAKERRIMLARRVFTQAAKEYGYRGKEIAEYLRKDPASVSGYLQGEEVGTEVSKVIKELGNVNTEV